MFTKAGEEQDSIQQVIGENKTQDKLRRGFNFVEGISNAKYTGREGLGPSSSENQG